MDKINRTFTYTDSDERGIEGWVPNWIRGFDASFGFGVAHDVLEHTRSPNGSSENECMALGTMLWGRAGGGYWANKGRERTEFHQNVIGDMVEFLSRDFAQCRPLKQRHYQLDDWAESELEYTHDALVKEWMSYIDSDDHVRWRDRDIGEIARNAMSWVRAGYRKAEFRYKSINPSLYCDIFTQIENNPLVSRPDLRATKGDVLHVEVHVPRVHTRIWLNDDRDY